MIYQTKKPNLQSGQAMLLGILFFLTITSTIVLGTANPILKQVKISNDSIKSKESYYLSEGALEDALYRVKNSKNITSGDTVVVNGFTSTITIISTINGKTIETLTNRDGIVRKMQAQVIEGSGAAFNYGVQAGNGGFILAGGSKVNGNIYSNGTIVAKNGVTITGTAVAAGTANSIGGDTGSWGVYIGTGGVGDAWAHSVIGATVSGSLYCQTGTGNNKVCDTSRSDPPSQAYPFTDAGIQDLKDEISDSITTGWTYNGNLTIGYQGTTTNTLKHITGNLTINGGGTATMSDIEVDGDVTISGGGTLKAGPMKIDGDLNVGSTAFTLKGNVVVAGNVVVGSGATLNLASTLGSNSGIVISSGYIDLSGGGSFSGSGQAGSYPVLLTTSTCPSGTGCGTHNAIDLSGGAGAVVLVAQNGNLKMSGGVGARAVVANKITVDGGATITYDAGLADLNFSSGPSGGWNVSSWKEVQ